MTDDKQQQDDKPKFVLEVQSAQHVMPVGFQLAKLAEKIRQEVEKNNGKGNA